jgi:acyl-coenzyme A thioesterase PaaI-like protein
MTDEQQTIARLIEALPYCAHLGIRAHGGDTGMLLELPFSPHLIGNQTIPAIHGGVIGSFLETVAIAQVLWEGAVRPTPRPVNVTIDYLRTGRALMSFGRAEIVKQGRRVLNVHARMWQDDEAKPVAALQGHFLIASG